MNTTSTSPSVASNNNTSNNTSTGTTKRARKPCSNCINSKVACDQARPCGRCTKQGRQSTCVDVPRKQRNKKQRDDFPPVAVDLSHSHSHEHLHSHHHHSDSAPTTPTSSLYHNPASIRLSSSSSAPSLGAHAHSHPLSHTHPLSHSLSLHSHHAALHSAPFSALHAPRAQSPPHTPTSAPNYVWSQFQAPYQSYSPRDFYDKASLIPNNERPSSSGSSRTQSYQASNNYYASKMVPNYGKANFSAELHDFLLPNSEYAPAAYASLPNYAISPDTGHYASHPDVHPASTSASSMSGSSGYSSSNSYSTISNSPSHDDASTPSPPDPYGNPTSWHPSSSNDSPNVHPHQYPPQLSYPNPYSSHNSTHPPPPSHSSLNFNIHNNSLTMNTSTTHNTHNNHSNTSIINNINNINHIINISNSNNSPPQNSPPLPSTQDHTPPTSSNSPTSHSSSHFSNNSHMNYQQQPQMAQQMHYGNYQQSSPYDYYMPQSAPHPSEEPTFMVMMSSRVLVDCNFGFARLLGYDSPTSLVLGNGMVLLEELCPPQFQKYIMSVWKNVTEQGVKSFERFTSFKTRSGNIIFCTFTANVLDDNMHGVGVIKQVMEYGDLPPVLKAKMGDSFF